MGQSAHGRFFWGIAYDDEESYAAHKAAEAAGCDEDDSDLGERVYGRQKRLRKKTVPQVGHFKAGYYDNDGGDCLYVEASYKSAEWSETIEIESLAVGEGWREALLQAVTDLGLPWKEPTWLLTSFYG